jgi:hypothetical protein
MNTTNEYPPRHIKGFRPLVPSEQWHRTDFTPDMLPEGWRPLLLLNEEEQTVDEQVSRFGKWLRIPCPHGDVLPDDAHLRTRRPLPPPPPTFKHDGKTWNSHIPGDPCPVDVKVKVEVLFQLLVSDANCLAGRWNWGDGQDEWKIIGYRIPNAEPQDETAKLRERIAELEQHLATALTPRPLSEAGPVKEGFGRLFVNVAHPQHVRSMQWVGDTHFIDIRLPEPDPRAEYERAVAEAGGHYEAWLKAKGGVA